MLRTFLSKMAWTNDEILGLSRFLARRGATADVQSGNLADHRGCPKILLEALGLVHEAAIGFVCGGRHGIAVRHLAPAVVLVFRTRRELTIPANLFWDETPQA